MTGVNIKLLSHNLKPVGDAEKTVEDLLITLTTTGKDLLTTSDANSEDNCDNDGLYSH